MAEIGRFKGGSTLIMAAALAQGSTLWSYYLHVPILPGVTGEALDQELAGALARYGLDRHVRLVVADSRSVELPREPLDLLFVDGDHSYEGVRADFFRRSPLLREGCHLLFHDAVDTGGYGNVYPGVISAVAKIQRSSGFEREPWRDVHSSPGSAGRTALISPSCLLGAAPSRSTSVAVR